MALNVAGAYARWRGSAAFVWALCVFLAAWFAFNLLPGLPHFDHGFGVLNVILSSEASLSVALLIMATEKQDAVQRKQLEYMLNIMEAVQETLRDQKNGLVGASSLEDIKTAGAGVEPVDLESQDMVGRE